MPRKPRKPFCTTVEHYTISNPPAAPLHDLIGATLVDFDELATLKPNIRGQLIDDFEEAVRRARIGYRFQTRGVSDRQVAASVLMKDLATALENAGIPATRWRRLDDGSDRESLLFGVFRDLANDAWLELPKDLKVIGQSSKHWKPNTGASRQR